MSYKLPDFLLQPLPQLTPEEEAKKKKREEIVRQYQEMFPSGGTCCLAGFDMTPAMWDKYYSNLETCIRKHKRLEKLFPEWDNWDPDSDDWI